MIPCIKGRFLVVDEETIIDIDSIISVVSAIDDTGVIITVEENTKIWNSDISAKDIVKLILEYKVDA